MQNANFSDSSFMDYDEYNKKQKQNGGEPIDKILKNNPTGSFPPIFRISKEEKEKEMNKVRGFTVSKNKATVSIKEIMEERRNHKKPFLEL